MTQQLYKHLDGNSVAEIRNFLIGTGAAAPTVARQFQYRNGRIEYFDGTTAQQLATIADTNAASSFRGAIDLSSGALPTAAKATVRPNDALTAGNFFVVSVGGTIAGIGGADTTSPGDLIFLVGTDAAVAANWVGISRSLDISPFEIREAVTLASLTANTATLVKPTGIKTISSYLVLDGSAVLNGSFDESFTASGPNIGLTLTSLVAKSNLTVIFSGLA
ncbi:MAG: hypothetical protein ACRC62_27540 [Microcoleus sp.]